MSEQPSMRAILEKLQRVYGVPAHLREAIAAAMALGAPELLLSSAAVADAAELTSLRAMREALVKLRDRLAAGDTEEMAAAQEIDEVLAVAASPPSVSSPETAFRCDLLPDRNFGHNVHAHSVRTIDALLLAIERELADPAQPIARVEALARTIALLAGAPL